MSIFEETAERKELSDRKTTASDSSSIDWLLSSTVATSVRDGVTMDVDWNRKYSGMESHTGSDGMWGTTAAHDQDITFIVQLIISLTQKIDKMTQELGSLREAVLSSKREISLEELEDTDIEPIKLSREEAKTKILQLYEQEKELDYYDIISRFDIDLELVVQICAELEGEGRIEAIE